MALEVNIYKDTTGAKLTTCVISLDINRHLNHNIN